MENEPLDTVPTLTSLTNEPDSANADKFRPVNFHLIIVVSFTLPSRPPKTPDKRELWGAMLQGTRTVFTPFLFSHIRT